jgi:hypothetical protein
MPGLLISETGKSPALLLTLVGNLHYWLLLAVRGHIEIGRASCRERVCSVV